MPKYRYRGNHERIFPYAHPAVVVSPGEIIERSENPSPRWFELVVELPDSDPTPSERVVDEEESA